jgi:hypothetical protein
MGRPTKIQTLMKQSFINYINKNNTFCMTGIPFFKELMQFIKYIPNSDGDIIRQDSNYMYFYYSPNTPIYVYDPEYNNWTTCSREQVYSDLAGCTVEYLEE